MSDGFCSRQYADYPAMRKQCSVTITLKVTEREIKEVFAENCKQRKGKAHYRKYSTYYPRIREYIKYTVTYCKKGSS